MEAGGPGSAAVPPAAAVAAGDASTEGAQLAADVLVAAIGLSLWVASGSLVLAVVSGLGAHPVKRVAVGAFLVLVGVSGLALRSRVYGGLRDRPWLVVPLAAILLAAISVDGLVGGPYVAVSLTAIGIGAVAARARTVWLCVGVLMVGYAGGVLFGHTPGELSRSGQLASVIGALAGYPVAAALLLSLRRRFTHFVESFEPRLEAVRQSPSGTTAALEQALRAQPIGLPAPRPAPASPLTTMERRVIDGLASGRTPKELAFQWGVSINTVRTHISNAKRKTGARTLRELASERPDAAPSCVDA